MKAIESNVKSTCDRDDDLGEQRGAVDIEEPIERAPDAVVAQMGQIGLGNAEERSGEGGGGFLLAVDRLALDDDGAQQHAQRLRVRHGWATMMLATVQMLLKEIEHPHALEEVIHQR